MARQYYDDDDYGGGSGGGGIIGIIGMLVVGGFILILILTIVPAILGLLLTGITGGIGGNAVGTAFPIATLNANALGGRRKRSAGTGIPGTFSIQSALSSLEKAYKAYSNN